MFIIYMEMMASWLLIYVKTYQSVHCRCTDYCTSINVCKEITKLCISKDNIKRIEGKVQTGWIYLPHIYFTMNLWMEYIMLLKINKKNIFIIA